MDRSNQCNLNEIQHIMKKNVRRDPYTLVRQCRTVIRSHVRTIMGNLYSLHNMTLSSPFPGPGENVRRIIRQLPRTELPKTLFDFLTFETWSLFPLWNIKIYCLFGSDSWYIRHNFNSIGCVLFTSNGVLPLLWS